MVSGSNTRYKSVISKLPRLIYGTAWKQEKTCDLVVRAITAGFRGIDTAGQPKHYYEPGVGEALKELQSQGVMRDRLFIQTKFTPISGQDPARIPYDPTAPFSVQVAQSFASSQKNLRTDYVDSLVLHSPLSQWSQMMEVWKAMEAIYAQGGAKMLGISNCYDLEVLKALYESSAIKPAVVQNRFYSNTEYDAELRFWCKHRGIEYQSFWTLTANPHILGSSVTQQIAKAHARTVAQVFFRFLTQIGIVPLTGTHSELHMREDLEIFNFELSEQEIDLFQAQLL